MIILPNVGIGNLKSVSRMLDKVGAKHSITTNSDDLKHADKVILVGVGHFDSYLESLKKYDFHEPIRDILLENDKPFLGICVGMQVLYEGSEEGLAKGYEVFKGHFQKFKFNEKENFKVPHMGWNSVKPNPEYSNFFTNDEFERFYFVHSYRVVMEVDNQQLSSTFYGESFTSSAVNKNIFGVQFHPEKSHIYGLNFLKKFAELDAI